MIKINWVTIMFTLYVWVLCSVMGAFVKNLNNSCGVDYPIDYFIFTNLFCPIEESDNSEN